MYDYFPTPFFKHSVTYLNCPDLDNCNDCNGNPGCGWCSDDDTCYYGDEIGTIQNELIEPDTPFTCRKWHFNECPSAAIPVMNAIVTAIIAVMLLVNLLTTIWQDSDPEATSAREEWYRFQRSSKAWLGIYQMQLVGASGLIGNTYPTLFVSFTQ